MKYLKLFENVDKIRLDLSKEDIKKDIYDYFSQKSELSLVNVIFHLKSTLSNDNLSDKFADTNNLVTYATKKFYLIGGKYVDYFMEGFKQVHQELFDFENNYLKPLVYDCFAEIIHDLIEESDKNLEIYLDEIKGKLMKGPKLPHAIINHALLKQYKRGADGGLWNTEIEN